MILQGKTEFGQTRWDQVGLGPAEPAVPSYASGRDPPEGMFWLCASITAVPARGWPYSIATRIPPGPKIIKNAIFDDFENLQKMVFFDGFGPWD